MVVPTKGARFMSPICEEVKLYGGSSMYVDRAAVMTVDHANRTA